MAGRSRVEQITGKARGGILQQESDKVSTNEVENPYNSPGCVVTPVRICARFRWFRFECMRIGEIRAATPGFRPNPGGWFRSVDHEDVPLSKTEHGLAGRVSRQHPFGESKMRFCTLGKSGRTHDWRTGCRDRHGRLGSFSCRDRNKGAFSFTIAANTKLLERPLPPYVLTAIPRQDLACQKVPYTADINVKEEQACVKGL